MDFDGATPLTFSVPPGNGDALEIIVNVPFTFVRDSINEAEEGLIARISITGFEDQNDANLVQPTDMDTALLRISDDDG